MTFEPTGLPHWSPPTIRMVEQRDQTLRLLPESLTLLSYLLETSVPGIFAVGDVRQGVVRRIASAVGQGASAISFVHQYLTTM